MHQNARNQIDQDNWKIDSSTMMCGGEDVSKIKTTTKAYNR